MAVPVGAAHVDSPIRPQLVQVEIGGCRDGDETVPFTDYRPRRFQVGGLEVILEDEPARGDIKVAGVGRDPGTRAKTFKRQDKGALVAKTPRAAVKIVEV